MIVRQSCVGSREQEGAVLICWFLCIVRIQKPRSQCSSCSRSRCTAARYMSAHLKDADRGPITDVDVLTALCCHEDRLSALETRPRPRYCGFRLRRISLLVLLRAHAHRAAT